MAIIKFNINDDPADRNFNLQFRLEVLKVIAHLNSIFSDKYEGVFVITVDRQQPGVNYIIKPGEEVEEIMRTAYVAFLEKKLVEIASSLDQVTPSEG